MSIKISIRKSLNPKSIKNYVFFTDKNFRVTEISKLPVSKYASFINKSLNSSELGNKNFLSLNINATQKVILIRIKDSQSPFDIEKIGAEFYVYLKSNLYLKATFYEQNIRNTFPKNKFFFDQFAQGLQLKSYEFNKYKSKSKEKNFDIEVLNKNKNFQFNRDKKYKSLIEGTNLTKDLVSEPGNILHPDEYAKRLLQLRKLGLKVNVLDKKKLKKLGMNALLGVGQGSIRGSYLVTLEWKGARAKKKPLAFVGKGVCFDTGGISLKPAKFMEDMTYDMAGSAVVVGLMKNLALRKAKINAIGVVGLVENMPGGNAQRPGDIVKSYSGKTIEVLNTDAEGRLVLADALTYTEKKYKPEFIVDLATLTGAIIVSLGSEFAGL
ncbi:MAG: leucyl aminopeptidase, partial [Pseudomonadota bacterium]|nr:leucyl aminopeptidase [Pseudomonadota bacterium]